MKTFTAFRGISPDNVRGRYVDNIFEDQRHRLFGGNTIRKDYEMSIPGANITEYDNEKRCGYLIELAAPGYDKKDFQIDLNKDRLTISAEQDKDRVRNRESFSSQEYNYHTFSRSWNLPESVDEDNITAQYRNGILEVFIPVNKAVEETSAPRRIAVGG